MADPRAQAAHPRRPGFAGRPTPEPEPGVFTTDQLDELEAFFRAEGYAILRGAYDEATLVELDADMARCQAQLIAGELPERHGTVILDDPDAVVDDEPFAHYVTHLTECSEPADRATHEPTVVAMMQRLLGPDCWLLDDDRFGVVFQDARPGDQLRLLPDRLALRLAVRTAPRHVAVGGVHHPPRRHLAGQRLPPCGAAQPPRRHRRHAARVREGDR